MKKWNNKNDERHTKDSMYYLDILTNNLNKSNSEGKKSTKRNSRINFTTTHFINR